MFNLKVYTMKRQRFFEGLGLKVYVTLAICMALLLNVQFLNAQSSTINVKGVVNDAMGPVIGASVVEKGNATNGTITDIDGNFSLKVPSDATLTISFIGYKTVELPVAGKTSFTVTLKEDSEILDEVVVVGFGTQKKVNLTGSVGLATAKEIEARPVANATQALQGLVPGLQITTNTGELDKNMSINIRGNGTIGDGSSGSPLILIDGMEGCCRFLYLWVACTVRCYLGDYQERQIGQADYQLQQQLPLQQSGESAGDDGLLYLCQLLQ